MGSGSEATPVPPSPEPVVPTDAPPPPPQDPSPPAVELPVEPPAPPVVVDPPVEPPPPVVVEPPPPVVVEPPVEPPAPVVVDPPPSPVEPPPPVVVEPPPPPPPPQEPPPAPPVVVEPLVVRVDLASENPLVVDRTGKLTIRITNPGPVSLGGLTVRLTPPVGYTFAGPPGPVDPVGALTPAANDTCSVVGELVCSWAAVDPGPGVEMVTRVRIAADSPTFEGGTVLFTASASADPGAVTIDVGSGLALDLLGGSAMSRQTFDHARALTVAATTVACPPSGPCVSGAWGAQDLDADPTTINATSSALTLGPGGATVRWAGLYWGGGICETSCELVPKVRIGEGGYLPVTTEATSRIDGRVQGFAEVTDLFVGAKGELIVWVADLPVATNRSGGWALVVVIDASDPTETVAVVDGLTALPTRVGLEAAGEYTVTVLTAARLDRSPLLATVESNTLRLESATPTVRDRGGWELSRGVIMVSGPDGAELELGSDRGGWFGLAVLTTGPGTP